MTRKDYFIDENCFSYNGIDYERRDGRCYFLEESASLRKEMDGALVCRRISKAVYESMLKKAKEEVERRKRIYSCYHSSSNCFPT